MKLPFKVNEREKRFLVFGGIAVIMIVMFQFLTWYSDIKGEVREASDTRILMLEKQLNRIAAKDNMHKRLEKIKYDLKKRENAFLEGEKPPVAAAELQRFLKEKAVSLKIDVKQERTLTAVDAGPYVGVPVEVGFNATTEKLKDLLLELRKSKLLLTVSELKIKVTNVRNPSDVHATLVVTGFIREPGLKNTKEDKADNAS